jgi:hypothetical protein
VEILAGAEPIRLGSILFTLVEPHRGHEVAYNRWYERDHFYAGCMIGPYTFAGSRYVATAPLKTLRDPDPSVITGEPGRGSFLALYWILDGYHEVWNRWAVRQVNALHAAGRMFTERDHVHTLLYRFEWEQRREADGVPVELALDHPYRGVVATFVERAPEVSEEAFDTWLRTEHLPGLLPGTPAGLTAAFRPLPLLIDAPGDVPRQEADERRVLTLWFLDTDPRDTWEVVFGAHRRGVHEAGIGQVIAALPFIPTIPGTDTYTDQLWEPAGERAVPGARSA